MKKETWRKYYFEDGIVAWCRKYCASDLKRMEKEHGRCLRVEMYKI